MKHRQLRYVVALVAVLLGGVVMARTDVRPASSPDVRRHTSIGAGRYGVAARLCWRPTVCTTLAVEVTALLRPAATPGPAPADRHPEDVESPTLRMVALLLEIARWFLFACGPVMP